MIFLYSIYKRTDFLRGQVHMIRHIKLEGRRNFAILRNVTVEMWETGSAARVRSKKCTDKTFQCLTLNSRRGQFRGLVICTSIYRDNIQIVLVDLEAGNCFAVT
jgi:hypothetical protein